MPNPGGFLPFTNSSQERNEVRDNKSIKSSDVNPKRKNVKGRGREGRSTLGLETRPVNGSNREMSRTRRGSVLVKPGGKLKERMGQE